MVEKTRLRQFALILVTSFVLVLCTGCDSADAPPPNTVTVASDKKLIISQEPCFQRAQTDDGDEERECARKKRQPRRGGCSNPVDPQLQRDLNKALKKLGCPPIRVDSCWGPRSREAQRRVERGIPCGSSTSSSVTTTPGYGCSDCDVVRVRVDAPKGEDVLVRVGEGSRSGSAVTKTRTTSAPRDKDRDERAGRRIPRSLCKYHRDAGERFVIVEGLEYGDPQEVALRRAHHDVCPHNPRVTRSSAEEDEPRRRGRRKKRH